MSSCPVELLFLACCVASFVSCSAILTCFSVFFYLFVYDSVVVHRRVFRRVSELFVKALGFLCVCGSMEPLQFD